MKRVIFYLIGKFSVSANEFYFVDFWIRVFLHLPCRIAWLPYIQVGQKFLTNSESSAESIKNSLGVYRLFFEKYKFLKGASLVRFFQKIESKVGTHLKEWPHDEMLMSFWNKNKKISVCSESDYSHEVLDSVYHLASLSDSRRVKHENDFRKYSDNFGFKLLQALHPFLVAEKTSSDFEKNQCAKILPVVSEILPSYPFFDYFSNCKSEDEFKRLSKGFRERPFGVNLIGHAYNIFGIGEDIRMAVKALMSQGIPVCVVNYPARNGSQSNDKTLQEFARIQHDGGGPYAFNLICMAAPSQARWMLERGISALQGRYTIASWPWETKIWPTEWNVLMNFVDQIWASSFFTGSAFERISKEKEVAMKVIPMASEIENPQKYSTADAKFSSRTHYGIPVDDFIFCYGFDFNSTASRKNPMEAVEVSQKAFPKNDVTKSVGLVIKTFMPKSPNREWKWLLRRQQDDPRIRIFSSTLPKESIYGYMVVVMSFYLFIVQKDMDGVWLKRFSWVCSCCYQIWRKY